MVNFPVARTFLGTPPKTGAVRPTTREEPRNLGAAQCRRLKWARDNSIVHRFSNFVEGAPAGTDFPARPGSLHGPHGAGQRRIRAAATGASARGRNRPLNPRPLNNSAQDSPADVLDRFV